MDNGFNLYFYVQDVQGAWINLFLKPYALSTHKVEAHKHYYLQTTCVYASDNLDALRRLLINTCASELINELKNVNLRTTPMY